MSQSTQQVSPIQRTAALVAYHVAPAAAAVGLAVGIEEEGVAAGAGDDDYAAVDQAGARAAHRVRADGVVQRGRRVEPLQGLRQDGVALLLLAAAQIQALRTVRGRVISAHAGRERISPVCGRSMRAYENYKSRDGRKF